MFPRALMPPRGAFFLFGPRGTGKSTWIRSQFDRALVVNLLQTELALRLEREPALFRAQVLARPKSEWIVVDEVQRVPALLDEVHYLMEEKGYRRFALTGSSARKLKRGSANLLAGRALLRKLFPLTAAETGFSVPVDQRLRYGSMPLSIVAADDRAREAYLRAFVTTYLVEEVRAEGLVRDLGGFSRFLDVAALAAGQTTNVSALSRDAGVSRETARGHFEVLTDTLIGEWLPAWRPRAKVKEVAQPKFYWFDPGVLHAAAGGFDQPLSAGWDGVLLEHLILQELRAHLHYADVSGSLGYWATPSGGEVDFVWWRGSNAVAIEVKSSRRYRDEYRAGIRSFAAGFKGRVASWIVYRGDEELRVDGTRVLPVAAFLECLHRGEVLR
jgi:predicted AAA+ superfamily ATPase